MATDTTEEKDPYLIAKEAEAKILKLQTDLQHVRQRIQLAESEERAEVEECEKKIQANDELIKKLGAAVRDLQISKHKGAYGDERIIAKAFQDYAKEVEILAGKSGREAIGILDEKLLFQIKKSNALSHELTLKDKHLAKLKTKIKDVAWNTYNEFEVEQPESETFRRVREMENNYQKIEKNMMECQIIQAKYKAIYEQLKREITVYPSLLAEMEELYAAQCEDVAKLMGCEGRAQVRREAARKELARVEAAALRARQDKERLIAEYNKALKPKQGMAEQRQSVDLRDSEAAEQWRNMRAEQEGQLKFFLETFEKIKEAIGISDINDAEERFTWQKATREELTEMGKAAEERLRALKTEALELQTKNESMRGAELASPQIVLEKELEDAKVRQEEEVKRKAAAEAELERINKLYADIKSGLWQQLQLMEKYLYEDDEETATMPDEDVKTIVSSIEELLLRVLENFQGENLEELKKTLNEEEFFPTMEPSKLVPSAGPGRKLRVAEEEESSDDEDFEKKRTMLKKDAQIYAEMKKKQQGRGRMMML